MSVFLIGKSRTIKIGVILFIIHKKQISISRMFIFRKDSFLTFIVASVCTLNSFGQVQKEVLHWEPESTTPVIADESRFVVKTPLACDECYYSVIGDLNIPYISKIIDATSQEVVSVNIKNVVTKKTDINDYQNISSDFKIELVTTFERNKKLTTAILTPLKKSGNDMEYITSFEWDVKTTSTSRYSSKLKNKKGQPTSSVLSKGDFYKVSVTQEGVFRLDQDVFSALGINSSDVDLANLKVYGNKGTMLPEPIATDRPQDLEENALFIHDENGNGSLDAEDYALWYAPGPTKISFDDKANNYSAESHDYDVAAYYFITWSGSAGKRISSLASEQGIVPDKTVTKYDHLIYHEKNEENHIKSGRKWWGDKMQIVPIKTFSYVINGALANEEAAFRAVTTGRSYGGVGSIMSFRFNGRSIGSVPYNQVDGSYEQNFATYPITSKFDFALESNKVDITFSYNKSLNEAAAWIDYFTIAVPRQLAVFDNQQVIRTDRYKLDGSVAYTIQNFNSSHRIWDISDYKNPQIQTTFTEGSTESFIKSDADSSSPAKYIIINPESAPLPSVIGKVENQNLHGIDGVDYIMITHESLLDEAERLAEFHRLRGLDVVLATGEQVFNEFSSGAQDVTGIRDFIKMVYDRGEESGDKLSYVLLFGDASYDYKDVEENNTNLVPIYQSINSNNPTASYCSDDYYAIMNDNEGYWGIGNEDEDLDLFVGRLPVSNEDEAKIVVDKIIHYHSAASRGNWIQTATFVADDEDGNRHLNPSEEMTDSVSAANGELNIKKIWLDAYEQVSFGSGNKYPKVNEEITKMIGSQGTLIFNYVGHGGENGMAHERIVTRPEILSWTNYNKLVFYITASCELAKIDNLDIESPGELMLLNPSGGAIGLLATTRLVFIGTNTDLNKKLLESNLLQEKNGQYPSLGEAYLNTRNRDKNESVNARCFILLGDPAVRLLNPEYQVVTTSINGTPATSFTDTLNALELVTIEGEIRNQDNNTLLSDFNGELFPTFFDKPSSYKTLGQDAASAPIEFQEQNRVIYKGNVTIQNGKFSFQFIVPKDIAYNIGPGKLSYYAKDGLYHAGGADFSYYIGGTADSLVNDEQFDQLNLYIDDEQWVFGGLTSNTPKLLALLSDSNGINTIGSGIGREMEAIVDEGTEFEQIIILNDFYKPDLNSYQSGRIEYPFEELTAGRHTLKLKVWDVYNNSAEAYTEFVVTESAEIRIENVLNYPNPFNSYTEFHFDHNKAGQNLKANVTITSVAGNVVKSITKEIINATSHSNEITWDGRDQYGDLLGRGVYLYTLSVEAEDGSLESKNQKLFIIN